MAQCLYSLVEARPENNFFGQPLYIGIGTPRRIGAHTQAARRGVHHNAGVQAVFDRHFRDGLVPTGRVLVIGKRDYLSDLEKKAIKLYGRRGFADERGSLCNIAQGGEGPDPSLMQRPEIREKISRASKKHWSVQSNRAALSVSQTEMFKSEALRKRIGDATRTAFKDPDVRQRHLTALTKVNAALSSEKRSEIGKLSYAQDPARRERLKVTSKEVGSRPEVIEARRTATRALNFAAWADPIIRAKRIAGMKGSKARARARRAQIE